MCKFAYGALGEKQAAGFQSKVGEQYFPELGQGIEFGDGFVASLVALRIGVEGKQAS